MTTAHRPTFDPARGKDAQRGPAYHQRLLPAHTVLKHRQAGQGGVGGLGAAPRDLRAELLKAEAAVKARSGGALPEPQFDDEGGEAATPSTKRKLLTNEDADAAAAEEEEEEEDPETKRRRIILEEARDVDADSDSSTHSASDSDSDSDSEDEEAELLRELAKIKAERAAQRLAEEAKQAAEAQEKREVDIALGNPLLNKERQQEFGVKRRWDDDVVFKNQARGTEERAKGRKEFVNDLLRSDFHKRFMGRYVR